MRAAPKSLSSNARGLPASWLIGKCRAWYDRRKAARVLYELDDRMLKDIGIVRADISSALRGDLRRP